MRRASTHRIGCGGRGAEPTVKTTARAIATAHLKEAPLDLTLRDDAETWCATLDGVLLPTGTLRRSAGGALATLPGYAEGAWWVQDAAAALPARLFGDIAGREVIDLCAAPGGKTAQLATAGARVTAVDRSTRRLERLVANLERLDLPVEAVGADALTWRPPGPVEAVLLDAPCSTTGAIRRHPDVPHLKSPEDVARLSAVSTEFAASGNRYAQAGRHACLLQPARWSRKRGRRVSNRCFTPARRSSGARS